MSTAPPIPSFRKNDLVVPRETDLSQGANGWRRPSQEEIRKWKESITIDNYPYGLKSEVPSDIVFFIRHGTIMIVTQPRVEAPIGESDLAKDCCEVLCPHNGELLYFQRHDLQRLRRGSDLS
jgi:hypothetical protein